MANTNPCASTALYESLVYCKGTTVLPGLRPYIYYIAKSDIVTFPTPPSTVPSGGSMAALATITGDFVLKADAKWKKIDIVASASNVNSESQGEAPARRSTTPARSATRATTPKPQHSVARPTPTTSCICGLSVTASTVCWATRCLRPIPLPLKKAAALRLMPVVPLSMWQLPTLCPRRSTPARLRPKTVISVAPMAALSPVNNITASSNQ